VHYKCFKRLGNDREQAIQVHEVIGIKKGFACHKVLGEYHIPSTPMTTENPTRQKHYQCFKRLGDNREQAIQVHEVIGLNKGLLATKFLESILPITCRET